MKKKKTIEIKKEDVVKSYEEARKAGENGYMRFLENLFGKDLFMPKDITERVKTFEDACNELGENHPLVKDWQYWQGGSSDLRAYLKLRIICAALNEGWEPQFTENEWRWYPWLCQYTQEELDETSGEEKQERCIIDVSGRNAGYYAGFGFAYSDYAPSTASAYFGSRLCLKSGTLAEYCGRQFIEIWADFVL